MQRSRRILLVAHCVLNQNSVIPHEARSSGMMKAAVDWCYEQGFGLLQLPCPEFTYLGPDRPSMTRHEYNTPEYRVHCRRLLEPILDQLSTYLRHGYQVGGVIGIGQSPSCDPGRGILLEELLALAARAGIELPSIWQIPATAEGHFDPSDPDCQFQRAR